MILFLCYVNVILVDLIVARFDFSSNPLLLFSLMRVQISSLFEALRTEPVISCLFFK